MVTPYQRRCRSHRYTAQLSYQSGRVCRFGESVCSYQCVGIIAVGLRICEIFDRGEAHASHHLDLALRLAKLTNGRVIVHDWTVLNRGRDLGELHVG